MPVSCSKRPQPRSTVRWSSIHIADSPRGWALGTVYLEQGLPEEALGVFQREEMEPFQPAGAHGSAACAGATLRSPDAALQELVEKGAERQRVSDCAGIRPPARGRLPAFAWLEA